MLIRTATPEDIQLIQTLAQEIWWPAYAGILSDEQIAFMLTNGYSEKTLTTQFETGQYFLIAENGEVAVGFAGYTFPEGVLKINKLYILPAEQGKGTGRAVLDYLAALAISRGIRMLELNVNRDNPALHFYIKYGFEISETVDIPYHGFVLNDYVMRKLL